MKPPPIPVPGQLVRLIKEEGRGYPIGMLGQISGWNKPTSTWEVKFAIQPALPYDPDEALIVYEMVEVKGQKVSKLGIRREPGYLYYVEELEGITRVMRVPMGTDKAKEVVINCHGIKKKPGFIYYFDKDGDVAETPSVQGAVEKPKAEAKLQGSVASHKLRQETKVVGGSMGLQLEQKRLKRGKFTSYIKGTKILHREDGPANENEFFTSYDLFGLRHRVGGPAYTNKYGDKEWFLMGTEHNLEGPSRISGGTECWSIFGNDLSKKQFDDLVKNEAFMKRARKLEKAIIEAMSGLDPVEVKDLTKKKQEGSAFPMLALGAIGFGGLVLAGRKVSQMKAEKQKQKVVSK